MGGWLNSNLVDACKSLKDYELNMSLYKCSLTLHKIMLLLSVLGNRFTQDVSDVRCLDVGKFKWINLKKTIYSLWKPVSHLDKPH